MSNNNDIAGFFAGGGKSAKFPKIGDTVEGEILKVHEPEAQTDFETKLPIPGKMQIRIELATKLRDPEVEDDDGKRTLFVKGWLTGAIAEALRKAKAAEPAVGGRLAVTYVSDGAPTRPGLKGPKQYTAVYVPPAAEYFSKLKDKAAGGAPIPEEAPEGIDPKAWATMPASAKQAIADAAKQSV